MQDNLIYPTCPDRYRQPLATFRLQDEAQDNPATDTSPLPANTGDASRALTNQESSTHHLKSLLLSVMTQLITTHLVYAQRHGQPLHNWLQQCTLDSDSRHEDD